MPGVKTARGDADTRHIVLTRKHGLMRRYEPEDFLGFVSASLANLVAAEMVGADRGLGYLILESERTFRTPMMFVGIFVSLSSDIS